MAALGRTLSRFSDGARPLTWGTWITVVYFYFAVLGYMMTVWEISDRAADRAKSSLLTQDTQFDFIIVGAGTAGSVLARRLSENPKWKILLIEAGGEPHPLQQVPCMANFLLNYPESDWMHKTVPQKEACRSLLNQRSGWSQGKSLGGTGNLNYMIYLRGSPQDYNNWAKLTGDPRWSYEGVLPYFRKLEDFQGDWPTGLGDKIHGIGGPVGIGIPDYVGIGNDFVNAGIEMGYKKVDLNGNYTEGFDLIYQSSRKGRRGGSYRDYIKAARKRPNLTIYKYAHVNKILFRGPNIEAYGVEFDRHGKRRTIFATTEIILSAGAIQSPKLLMLSGIGPKAHLQSKNIPVIHDLPGVGQNLQDHITVYLGPFETAEGKTFIIDRDLKPSNVAKYLLSGKGPYTSSGVHAGAVISSTHAKQRGEGNWPDIQLLFYGFAVGKEFAKSLEHAFHVNSSISSDYFAKSLGKDSFLIVASLGRPKARGEILLNSADPQDDLIIDPKYLQNDQDMQVLLEGAQIAMYIAENTTVFQKMSTKFTRAVWSGCENFVFKSKAYLECFIRHVSITYHHIVGSCSMGSANSPLSVVDTDLRVRGVRNLRVVDASVIPVVPVTNTQSPVFMIAEMASDLIKKQWGFI